jgi:hypothetical protein
MARPCSSSFLASAISLAIVEACLTASTTFPEGIQQSRKKCVPVPASPFVLIITAPSSILLKASPKFLAPQTKGIYEDVRHLRNIFFEP